MANQQDLAGVLDELNSSLSQLADDKSAWQALVSDLQSQVSELQTQLDAQAENVVDPATVASIKSISDQLKEAVDNFTVPAPVTAPAGGDGTTAPVTDPTAPAEGTPSPSGPTPVPISTDPAPPAPPADVPTPPDATAPDLPPATPVPGDTTVAEPGAEGTTPLDPTDPAAPVDPSTQQATTGTVPTDPSAPPADPTQVPVEEGGTPVVDTTAPGDVATNDPAGPQPVDVNAAPVPAGSLDPGTAVVEVPGDVTPVVVPDGAQATTAGSLPDDAVVTPVVEP